MKLWLTSLAALLLTGTMAIAQEVSYGNPTTKTTTIEDIPQNETWMIAAMDADTHVLVNCLAGEGDPQLLVLGSDPQERSWVNVVSGTCKKGYSFPVGTMLPVQFPSGYSILISTPPGKYVWIVKGSKK